MSIALGILSKTVMLLNCPAIGLPCTSSLNSAFSSAALQTLFNVLVRGLPIMPAGFDETGKNQIGTQVLISSNSDNKVTSVVTDNVAPLARTWNVDGYVSLVGNEAVANMPLLDPALVAQVAGLDGMHRVESSIFIQLCKMYIRYVRNERSPFWFYTKDGERVKALIEQYQFIDEAENEFALHVKLSVHEYLSLGVAGSDGLGQSLAQNEPPEGSVFGSASAGAVLAASGVLAIAKVTERLQTEVFNSVTQALNDNSNSAGTKVWWGSGSENEEATPEQEALQEANYTEPALAMMFNRKMWRGTRFLPHVFASLYTKAEDGTDSYLDAVSCPLNAVGFTGTMEVRKTSKDEAWWIIVTGELDTGEKMFRQTRVQFNCVLFDTDVFAVLLVSASLPADGEVEFDSLTPKQQLDVLIGASAVVAVSATTEDAST